ncbi:hypothetical protein [Georgenia yuyongxinii]
MQKARSRNLRKQIGLSQADTDRLEALMNAYIEYALIDVEAAGLATVVDAEMDAKTLHVLRPPSVPTPTYPSRATHRALPGDYDDKVTL